MTIEGFDRRQWGKAAMLLRLRYQRWTASCLYPVIIHG